MGDLLGLIHERIPQRIRFVQKCSDGKGRRGPRCWRRRPGINLEPRARAGSDRRLHSPLRSHPLSSARVSPELSFPLRPGCHSGEDKLQCMLHSVNYLRGWCPEPRGHPSAGSPQTGGEGLRGELWAGSAASLRSERRLEPLALGTRPSEDASWPVSQGDGWHRPVGTEKRNGTVPFPRCSGTERSGRTAAVILVSDEEL